MKVTWHMLSLDKSVVLSLMNQDEHLRFLYGYKFLQQFDELDDVTHHP